VSAGRLLGGGLTVILPGDLSAETSSPADRTEIALNRSPSPNVKPPPRPGLSMVRVLTIRGVFPGKSGSMRRPWCRMSWGGGACGRAAAGEAAAMSADAAAARARLGTAREGVVAGILGLTSRRRPGAGPARRRA
jgi:hypothetical protein